MTFMHCLNFILDLEGGYVNDPKDPGGETKWGISKRSHPYVDIKTMTKEHAARIYREEYWSPARCQHVPKDMTLTVFDCAVNQGVSRAVSWYEEIQDRSDRFELFMARRMLHYAQLSSFQWYGKGWAKRLFLVARETGRMDSNGISST